jgi:putative membrane protein
MVVDCHNAMGKEISKIDSEDMLKAAKSCLDSLIAKKHHQLVFGYANSDEMNLSTPDLGLGGLGILCLKINEKKYFLAWADANNLENGVREHVVNHFSKNGYTLLEICTSDTHYTQTKVRTRMGYYQFGVLRTRMGYYQFGVLTKMQEIADWYLKLAKKAEKNMTPAKFEILEKESNVKIMGPTIIQNYSTALDKSMKLSKGFMIGSFILFLISMI